MMADASVQLDEWITDPPALARLHAAEVMHRMGVSLAEAARALKLSRTSVHQLTTKNQWPIRASADLLKLRLRDFLRQQGASEQDLAVLFCAKRGAIDPARRGQVARRKVLDQKCEADVLLPKQTLSLQAKKHFKLFANPFDGPVERDEQFFAGDEIQFVREAAWQCAQTSSFLAIIGESGAGKTTIKADLEVRLAQDPRGALVIEPGVLGMEETDRAGQMLKAADILHAVISALCPSATVPQTLQGRTLLARKLLAASAQTGNTHLLVIEEAHGIPDPTLKHLKRLHEMRHGRRSLLGILLLGQPELKARLADGLRSGTLREVAQRCEIVELLPLDHDLGAYLQRRSGACGRALETIVESAAVDELRSRLTRKTTAGQVNLTYPLSASNAVTRAMNLAAEIGVPLVTAEVVRSI